MYPDLDMYPIVIIIVITLICLLVVMWRSASILLNYMKVRKDFESSLKWPSTMGQITSSSVEESVWYSKTMGNSFIYYPEVNYLYIVNNKEYDGNRVRFGANIGTSKKQEAHTITKKYSENASVKIYYDPQGPANSVIERELVDYYKKAITQEFVKFVFCTIIFVVIGFYLAIVSF